MTPRRIGAVAQTVSKAVSRRTMLRYAGGGALAGLVGAAAGGQAAAAPSLDATSVSITNHGTRTLGPDEERWFGIANNAFSSAGWQRLSVFPTDTNPKPAKVTILEEDWTIDETGAYVCWVLVHNDIKDRTIEFAITSLATQG